MESELSLESLPSPGEPLRHSIDDMNQSLLELSVQERIQRQESRLTRRQKFWLQRRWNRLKNKLNRAGYNDLIVQRHECWQQYKRLRYVLKTQDKPGEIIRSQFEDVKAQGRKLNQKLDALQALADEFDSLNARLRAHNELLAWEREDKENFQAFLREARTWEAQLEAAFKQSPRLHHRGTDEKGRPFTDIPVIREIVVKDDRVMYLIKTTGQSLFERLLGRWHSALPYGVDVSSLISPETLENLSTACNRVVTVERSKRGTNLFYVISRLDAPDGIPKKVLYQKVIDWYPVQDHIKTPWAAGVTNDRQVDWYNFEDNPHVLIAGATQGGKSNHVNQIIATLVTMNTPQELRLVLVDLKGGIEFTHWRGLQHQLKDMLTTPESVLDGLRWLRSIMEKRLEMMEALKAKNLQSYNMKAQDKLPRIVCLVDEMATLIGLGELTSDLHTELRVLSAQGRAVGIHLVLCTQHSSVDVLPGWVKTNMSLRISAKMPSHQASMVILDSVTAATLPNVPGRLVFSSGRFERIAQSPYISDEEIVRSIKMANQFTAPDNSEFTKEYVKPVPKFTEDDAIRIALEHCESRLSAAKIHEVAGNEKITLRNLRNMCKNIIEDGLEDGIIFNGMFYTLKKVGNGYYLIATEQSNEQLTDRSTEPEISQNGHLENVMSLN